MSMNGSYAVIVCIVASAGAAFGDVPETVRIGGIFDMDWGEGMQGVHLAEMAVDDFNAYLEYMGVDWSVSISIEDSQSLSPVALNKIQDFHSAGIDMLVGLGYSSHISLASKYIETNDILVISHASEATNLAVDDSVFRLVPNSGSQSPIISGMVHDADIEVLVSVVRGGSWSDGIMAGVEESYPGMIVPGIRYDSNTPDFSEDALLLDELVSGLIEEYGADKVGVLYLGNDELLTLIHAVDPYESLGHIRWFGSNNQINSNYLVDDPAASEFTDSTNFTAVRSIPGTGNALREDLDSRYMAMYNATISTYGYAAYDSVWLLGTAILHTQSVDTVLLSNTIPLVAAHMQGTSGDLTLTEYGDLATAIFEVWQINDGAWMRIS